MFTYKCIELGGERGIIFERTTVEEPVEPEMSITVAYVAKKRQDFKLADNRMEMTARKSGGTTFFLRGIRKRICTAYIYKSKIEFGNPNEPEKFNIAIDSWKD